MTMREIPGTEEHVHKGELTHVNDFGEIITTFMFLLRKPT